MIVKSLDHLNQISKTISQKLENGDCIFLIGEIGVGKTTFTRHLINNLQNQEGVKETEVLSPTFNLLYEYEIKDLKIMHYDLYRIKKINEIDSNFNLPMIDKKKEKRIPFGYLLESGLVEPGLNLFDHKKKYKAQVMADGSIYCNKIQGSIHKVGAQVQGMPSCNGWSYWHFNIEGKLEPIDFLRRKVRETL